MVAGWRRGGNREARRWADDGVAAAAGDGELPRLLFSCFDGFFYKNLFTLNFFMRQFFFNFFLISFPFKFFLLNFFAFASNLFPLNFFSEKYLSENDIKVIKKKKIGWKIAWSG